jgi:hypothetical protein
MRTTTTKTVAQAKLDYARPLDQPDLFGASSPRSIINIGRRCRHCSGETFLKGAPKGPHGPRLDCVTCGEFWGWLSKARAASLSAMEGTAR